jgi:hypothetical protein
LLVEVMDTATTCGAAVTVTTMAGAEVAIAVGGNSVLYFLRPPLLAASFITIMFERF